LMLRSKRASGLATSNTGNPYSLARIE
jgi:hypothetical protein